MAFASHSTQYAEAQINMTPLVDVLLVLLVIFMVATPLPSRPIELILPQASPPDADRPEPPPPIRLRIDAAGALYWNGGAASAGELPRLFADEAAREPDQRPVVEVDADPDSDYQALATVLAAARNAELDVGFVRR